MVVILIIMAIELEQVEEVIFILFLFIQLNINSRYACSLFKFTLKLV